MLAKKRGRKGGENEKSGGMRGDSAMISLCV